MDTNEQREHEKQQIAIAVIIQKQAYKEALKEILAEVGLWTIKGIFFTLAGWALYIFLQAKGFPKL